MELSILAVEDKPRHYENLVSILKAIPPKDRDDWRISSLNFTRAATVKEAGALLEAAARARRPFDILVLDLKIPRDMGLTSHTDHGFEVLRAARRFVATRQTMIYTNHAGSQNIWDALREGANDFVQKPLGDGTTDRELQTRFMSCWQRVLENRCAELLEQRIKDLVPYAEVGLAHRVTVHFSEFLQTVADTAEDVAHYARERFGLDRDKDSQDYLIRSLRNQDAKLRAVRDNCARMDADLLTGVEKPEPKPLGALLDSIHEKLSPCLLVKNTTFQPNISDAGQTGVLTFQDDVRFIMQEITAGALSALSDYGSPHEMAVTARVNKDQAEIVFSDDLEERISDDDAQAINGGFIVGPHRGPERFGRAWGLSVAQHIAMRGGGRLIVKPQPSGRGSVVTYFAPVVSAGGTVSGA